MSEFCLYIGDNPFVDKSDLSQGYISWTGFTDKAYAISSLNKNSSLSAQENETDLGRIIAECYLNPLCFKLENSIDFD